MPKRALLLPAAITAVTAIAIFGLQRLTSVYLAMKEKETVQTIEAKTGGDARSRLKPFLAAAGFDSIPGRIALVAIKEDRTLELWAEKDDRMVLVKSYAFTAFSGKPGPKLKEGDKQIPEGIYAIEYLNPNSLFHLSMKVSYPNAFDKKMAAKDGRTNLGGDIFIHGKDRTIGCIPIGDAAIEEVFYLAGKTLPRGIKTVISPVDFRKGRQIPEIESVTWEKELYRAVRQELYLHFDN